MNKSITQDTQNDNQISKTIRRFFVRFHVSSALKSANAYRRKGIPAVEIFQYLFLLIFSNNGSSYRKKYASVRKGYGLSFYEHGSDQLDPFHNNPFKQDHQGSCCTVGF